MGLKTLSKRPQRAPFLLPSSEEIKRSGQWLYSAQISSWGRCRACQGSNLCLLTIISKFLLLICHSGSGIQLDQANYDFQMDVVK